MTDKSTRTGGSRFLYEPFDAASVRIDANQRINDERWVALEVRLVRLEMLMDRIDRRLWIALSGVAGVLAAEIAVTFMNTTS